MPYDWPMMPKLAEIFVHACALIHRWTMAAAMSLLAVSLAAQFAVVVLRYGFDVGYLWLNDLGLWSFAAAAALGVPVAVALDANVRVDLFDASRAPARAAMLDRLAAMLLLVFFLALFWLALPEAIASFRQGESSPQIGGLGFYWLVRGLLPLIAALSLLQGLARFLVSEAARGR